MNAPRHLSTLLRTAGKNESSAALDCVRGHGSKEFFVCKGVERGATYSNDRLDDLPRDLHETHSRSNVRGSNLRGYLRYPQGNGIRGNEPADTADSTAKPLMPELKDILERVERKLDMLLRHHEIDLSEEDAQVKQATEDISEAQQKLPLQQ